MRVSGAPNCPVRRAGSFAGGGSDQDVAPFGRFLGWCDVLVVRDPNVAWTPRIRPDGERQQNVEKLPLPRKRSTFCSPEKQNVDHGPENKRISTFCSLPEPPGDPDRLP
jgi:hypothetical protein